DRTTSRNWTRPLSVWRSCVPTAAPCGFTRPSFSASRTGPPRTEVEDKVPPVDRNNPTRAKSSESQYSVMEFMREFPDDDACLNRLWRSRYSPEGEHAYCPRCQTARRFRRYKTRHRAQAWTCTSCTYKLYPTAGTIFRKSSTSL